MATNTDQKGVKQVETPDGTLTYNDDNHTYNIDGVEIPATSQITGVLDKSGPLMGWAVKETANSFREQFKANTEYSQNEIEEMISTAKSARWRSSDEALNIGAAAHEWMERHIKDKIEGGDGLEDDLPDREEVLEAVVEFLEWEQNHVDEWLRSEEIVAIPVNLERMIGGTFDAYAETDQGRLVIDFKTSKSIYDSHLLQAGGYWSGMRYCYEEPNGFCILRTPKDEAEVEDHIVTDRGELAKHVLGFESAAQLYFWRQDNGL